MKQVPLISIIDDDESVRVATGNLVRSLGYLADAFASADEFLHSPRLDETRCLISDVQMPNMNGLELQDLLIVRGYNIPIIFITAFHNPNAEARALNAGALCFLRKPLGAQVLVKYVEAALKGQAP